MKMKKYISLSSRHARTFYIHTLTHTHIRNLKMNRNQHLDQQHLLHQQLLQRTVMKQYYYVIGILKDFFQQIQIEIQENIQKHRPEPELIQIKIIKITTMLL